MTALDCPNSPHSWHARPSLGIRLTSAYAGNITYFRNLYP